MKTLRAAATSTRPSSLPSGELDLREKSMLAVENDMKKKGFLLLFFSILAKKKTQRKEKNPHS